MVTNLASNDSGTTRGHTVTLTSLIHACLQSYSNAKMLVTLGEVLRLMHYHGYPSSLDSVCYLGFGVARVIAGVWEMAVWTRKP